MTDMQTIRQKFRSNITASGSTGVQGGEYPVFGESQVRVQTSGFGATNEVTIQVKIHDGSWSTLGVVTGNTDSTPLDVSAWDFVRFNITVADGTGVILASGFFSKAQSSGGGASAAFTVIQPDAGTSPTATGPTDTLTLTSSDGSITITGNATTDTIDLKALSGSGDVVGPASSTDSAIALFSGTTGKLLKNSTTTITSLNILSNPHSTYATSLGVGSGSIVAGDRGVTLGYGAYTSADGVGIGYGSIALSRVVAVGRNAISSGSGTNSVIVGYSAASSGTSAISIGYASSTLSTGSIAVGNLAVAGVATTGNYAFAMGQGATCYGAYSIAAGSSSTVTSGSDSCFAMGRNATAGGLLSMAAGAYSSSTYNYSIAIGAVATTTANNQLVIGGANAGSPSSYISSIYIGSGVTNAYKNAVTMNITGSSGTDVAGVNATLAGSRGTGTGVGGSIIMQTAPAGSTGSTLNAPVDMMIMNGYKEIIQRVNNSAVSDARLFAGSMSIYVDEGTDTIYFRVKYSDGTTLKTGSFTIT